MLRKITMSDVAREAGVGQVTVSRVVNGDKYVRAEVRARVQRAIAKLGYQPNEAARILKGQKARTIGLIVPTLEDPFFAACTQAVQNAARRHNYMTLIQTSGGQAETETEEIQAMLARSIAGLILIPMELDVSSALINVQEIGLPFVALDRGIKGLSVNEVVGENALGAEKGVQHLIDHGHKQIACLGYNTTIPSIRERIEGYTEAMKKRKLNPELWKAKSAKTLPSLLRRKLAGKKAPTALFTLNNVTTIQTLHTLRQMNLKVPKDIALVGFDDLEMGPLLMVPATVVRQSAHELGHTGTKLLMDLIKGGPQPRETAKTRLILPTELVIRNSCGCNKAMEPVIDF